MVSENGPALVVCGQRTHPSGDRVREGLTSEPDEHRALARVGEKAEGVVDAVHAPVVAEQEMSSLAVGVVDEHVERRQAAQLLLQRVALVAPSTAPCTKSCTDPAPCGPSLRVVGGTMPSSRAALTTYAATSRMCSVCSGKSHRGLSPRAGL
jgi:hypothetical protein